MTDVRSPGPAGTRRAGKCCRTIAETTSKSCPRLYDFCARISGLYLLADRALDIAILFIVWKKDQGSLWFTLQLVWLLWGAKLAVLWVLILTSTDPSSITATEDAEEQLERILAPTGTLAVICSIVPFSELCILPVFAEGFNDPALLIMYFFFLPVMWVATPLVLILQNITILVGRLLKRETSDLEFTLQEWLEIWICIPQITFQILAYVNIHEELTDSENTVFWISILFSVIGIVNAFRVWCYHYEDFFSLEQTSTEQHFSTPIPLRQQTSVMSEALPINVFKKNINSILCCLSSKEGVDFFCISSSSSSGSPSVGRDAEDSGDDENFE